MATKAKVRQIVKIDENKCNGCGLCVPNCAEGAIKIIDGKAKLLADNLCDGLGACLGHCPEDAIEIITRSAEDFDEVAVEKHLGHKEGNASGHGGGHGHHGGHHNHQENQSNSREERMKNHMHDHMSGGCPSARLLDLDAEKKAAKTDANRERTASRLTHWPVKLMLLPPTAPFLRGKELLLTADCVGVAHPELHNELMEGKAIAIACPKFDETEPYVEKLAEMAAHGGITGITVVHMEVPCCGGLAYMAKQAVEKSGTNIPVKTIIIGVRGDQLTK